MVEGDTFTVVETLISEEVDLIVTRVDSVELMDGTKRKRQFLICEERFGGTRFGEMVWIEGIGETRGLLEVDKSCTFDQVNTLLCFQENGEVLFQNEEFESCWEFTSTEDLAAHGLNLYPNPASDFIEIIGQTGTIDYKLFSIDGRGLLSGTSTGKIEVGTLPSGMYVLEFLVDGNRFTSRVVKH